jgi:hypothetical protein
MKEICYAVIASLITSVICYYLLDFSNRQSSEPDPYHNEMIITCTRGDVIDCNLDGIGDIIVYGRAK